MITVNNIVYNYCELQNELAAPVLTGVVLFISKFSSILLKKSSDFRHHSSIFYARNISPYQASHKHHHYLGCYYNAIVYNIIAVYSNHLSF